MDSTAIFVALISGVMLVGASGGLWAYRQAKLERPIKKAEVETATLLGLAGIDGAYGELFDNLTAEVKRQGEQLARQGEQLQSQGRRLEELERDLQTERHTSAGLRILLRRAVHFLEDLHTNWEYHRKQDRPPLGPDLTE